jgi:membrane dipeptidase
MADMVPDGDRAREGRRLVVDAHLDLAHNAIEANRDLTLPLGEIRAAEQHRADRRDRGRGTVCLPELRRGGFGLVVATQLAPVGHTPGRWSSPQQAWAMTQAQLAWYREMEALGEMVQVTDRAGLDAHVALWADSGTRPEAKPVGYILSLEGADSLVDPSYVHRAHAYGLRAIGPAHFGPGRYSPGTKSAGGLTPLGRELLAEMDALGMILDVTHLTDEALAEVLERYAGPIWASHCNVRSLTPIQRHLSEDQLRRLIERGAVIGGMLDAWALDERFIDGVSDPWQLDIRIERIVDHWDRICELAGNTEHIAIGTDLDGGFGTEQSPWDLDSIADVRRLETVLADRGYDEGDIDNVFHANWLRFLRRAWS